MPNKEKQEKKEQVTYNGGNYIVHIGPRGGKYIKCNGKKKYLDLPKTRQIPKMSL